MLLQQFLHRLKEHFHILPGQHKLLLAVSGGIDSVVLTDLVYKSGFDFIIAHCNFQLRGAESERDEAFVKSLEEKYSNPVLFKKFETGEYAARNKISIQEAARELRYSWFVSLMSDECSMANEDSKAIDDSRLTIHDWPLATRLVTAHNANDNIETSMMHFFRGTGIHGLTGIPESDAARRIIRPLLFATREAIVRYAKENNLQWVEDSSNTSDKYTRNFFRLQLIPAVKEVFPNAEENLLNNIERFKEVEQLYRQSIELHKKKLVEHRGNESHIPLPKLQKVMPLNAILWEIIKDFGFTSAQIHEIKKLFNAGNGSYVNSHTHRVIKNRNWLIIALLQTGTAKNILIEAGTKKVGFENGILVLEEIQTAGIKPQTSNLTALLDANEIKFPLLLRKWKLGDYFYPLGMQKKKKLSRFFIDQKLSKTEKEKVWVIESNKKILWIIGHRIDDRFKLTGNTKNALRIELKNN